MSWTVELSSTARRQLRKLPRATQERLRSAIDKLEADPFAGDVRKLVGTDDTWRLRVGEWRVVFEVEGDRLGQGRENVKNMLKETPELTERIETDVRERLGIPKTEAGAAAAG